MHPRSENTQMLSYFRTIEPFLYLKFEKKKDNSHKVHENSYWKGRTTLMEWVCRLLIVLFAFVEGRLE